MNFHILILSVHQINYAIKLKIAEKLQKSQNCSKNYNLLKQFVPVYIYFI